MDKFHTFLLFFLYVYAHTRVDIVIASILIWISSICIVVESISYDLKSRPTFHVQRSSFTWFDRLAKSNNWTNTDRNFSSIWQRFVVCDVIKLDDVDEAYVSKFICRC